MPSPVRCNNGWAVNFREASGRRHRKRFDTKRQAQAYINSTLERDEPRANSKYTLATFVEEYHRWSELVRQKRATTVAGYRQMIGTFLTFCEGRNVMTVDDLTPQLMRQYQAWWFKSYPFGGRPVDRRVSNGAATWEKYRQALAAWWYWGIENYPDLFPPNAATSKSLKVPTDHKAPSYMTDTEIAAILKYFDTRNNPGIYPAFYRTLLHTGMRLSECIGLQWDDVDLECSTITLKKTKTKYPRTIPIAPVLKPWLETQLRAEDQAYVFGHLEPAYSDKRYWQELRQCTLTMGLRNLRIHDFRHTFTKKLLESGVEMVTVQKLLGHQDIRTTAKYAQFFSLDRARDAVARLDIPERHTG